MLVSTRLALGLLGLCSLAQAQPPAPLPLEKVPHTREAMISWIRQQTAMGDRTATVSLADGTVLRGAVSGPDADGALLLATALAQAPLRVPAERVTKVEYRAQEKLTWSPPVRIDFRDGSWALAATVRALDGKEMLFDLPYAQDIRVPLSAVARVAFDGLAGPQPGSVANVEVFLGKRLLQAPQLELDNVDLRLFDGAQRLVPRGGRAVTLAPVPSSVAAPSRGRMRLRNGDLLTGVVQQLKADRLSFKMALGPELEVSTDDIAEVVLP